MSIAFQTLVIDVIAPGRRSMRTRRRVHSPARRVHRGDAVGEGVCRIRRGLTLLELLLALSLVSILLVAISMAVSVHLRTLESNRTYVEEAQLARMILRHIADDLHAAVTYQPFDTSGMEALPSTGMEGLLGASGGDEPSGNSGSGANGASNSNTSGANSSGSDSSGDAAATGDETASGESTAAVYIPGLYGTTTELWVDVSRLPRVDQYQPMIAAADFSPVSIPSDVKTVAYFLAGGAMGQVPISADPLLAFAAPGLYRRETDRAVTQWANQAGESAALNTAAELLSPEVVGLEFWYFDGVEWWPEWDSTAMGGLPVAVNITLALQPIGRGDARNPADFAGALSTSIEAEEVQTLYYQLVVHLPTGQSVQLQQQSAGTGMEELGL